MYNFKFDRNKAAALAKVLSIDLRIRAKLMRIRDDQQGASIAFVDATLYVGSKDAGVKLCVIPSIVVKLGSEAGRCLGMPTVVGNDQKRRPAFLPENEFRAVLQRAIFTDPQIKRMTEEMEAQLAKLAEKQDESNSDEEWDDLDGNSAEGEQQEERDLFADDIPF